MAKTKQKHLEMRPRVRGAVPPAPPAATTKPRSAIVAAVGPQVQKGAGEVVREEGGEEEKVGEEDA